MTELSVIRWWDRARRTAERLGATITYSEASFCVTVGDRTVTVNTLRELEVLLQGYEQRGNTDD